MQNKVCGSRLAEEKNTNKHLTAIIHLEVAIATQSGANTDKRVRDHRHKQVGIVRHLVEVGVQDCSMPVRLFKSVKRDVHSDRGVS